MNDSSLAYDLDSQLRGAPLERMAQHIGIEPSQASAAISAALPLLIGALGRNASQPQGAESLFGALQKDHTGLDLGSVLGSVLGNGGQGGQILGHIFGGKQPRAERGVGQIAGIGSDKAGALMQMLAPIVMSYLSSRLLGGASQQASPQVLGDVLGQEQHRVRQQGGIGGGLLSAVLDQDGDGELGLGDLLQAGEAFLGGRR